MREVALTKECENSIKSFFKTEKSILILKKMLFLSYLDEGLYYPDKVNRDIDEVLSNPDKIDEIEKRYKEEVDFLRECYGYKGGDIE